MITKALLINSLYHLYVDTGISNNEQSMNIVSKRHLKDNYNPKYFWHLRLSHIIEDRLNRLEKDGILRLSFDSILVCESCLQGKMTNLLFIGHKEWTNELLALVYTDVCSPFDVQARGGFSYFVTFTDDMSWYGYVFLMRHKPKSLESSKNFKKK